MQVAASSEPADSPPLPEDKPQGAPESATPAPERKPEKAAPPVPADKPAEAIRPTPVPQQKPAETDQPVADQKQEPDEANPTVPVPDEKPSDPAAPVGGENPADAVPPLPEEKPVDRGDDTDAADAADARADKPVGEDAAPKRPLFADDAMSPACAAIEEGRVSGRPLKPIEDPAGCVVPAVYAVSFVGLDRTVNLSPEAELNCAMAARLDRFVEEVVGPAAVDILGSALTGMGVAGSFVCRTRNGLADAVPSEHGTANAIDISSFTLADGRVITVAGDWADKVAADAAEGVAPGETAAGSGDDGPSEGEADTPAADPAAAPTVKDEGPESAERTPESRFLQVVHAKACGPFTTVIGPDGDKHHEDHFHFDLQPRGVNGSTTFCQ